METPPVKLELPHTAHCLVCGRANVRGLHLSLFVEPAAGIVTTHFTPAPEHIGFEGIIHGGVLATVLDEAMGWCAIWASARPCVAAEINIRFKSQASVGQSYIITAEPTRVHGRLIETRGTITNQANEIIATATGKFTPMPVAGAAHFVQTLLDEPSTDAAREYLRVRMLPGVR